MVKYSMAILQFTEKGIYCPQGNFYIDPHLAVDYAVITHGHSDHAFRGHKHYLSTPETESIMKHRLGKKIVTESMKYGKKKKINGVTVSFHPAAHVLGSAQVRVEYKGEVAVVTGDYKVENDNISGEFELVKCNTFVSECTFGLPLFNWQPQQYTFEEINAWWRNNAANGVNSVLNCYSLGKAQRILKNIDPDIGPIICHDSIESHNEIYEAFGNTLPERVPNTEHNNRALILAPSSASKTEWFKPFGRYSKGNASGWMIYDSWRRGVDAGFVLSDHCDFKALNWAVKETGADLVYLMHGYTKEFSSHLNKQGIFTKIVEELGNIQRENFAESTEDAE
jgi:putative mRNA 3-end processing factor